MQYSPIRRFRIPLGISSWAAFAISLTFYLLTVDPDISYWDCPEYVTVASRMEIGHPPGNPVWMLAMRVATIPFSPQYHALVVNVWSGIFMALAALFLCRFIFMALRVAFLNKINLTKVSSREIDIILGLISAGSALCFSLCDSAWFSAVEAEVYAMSAFISSVSLWIMVLWWYTPSRGARTRWLILLAYLTGLSLGVHQLNLLLLPVFAVMMFYRTHRKRVNPLKVTMVVIVSALAIGLILLVLVPGVLFGAQAFELAGVNHLGWPYHTGAALFCLLIFLLLCIAIYLTGKSGARRALYLNTSIWMAAFILLGFSSYTVILIRAQAYPAMNEGVPDNIFSLASYISRDQYPSSPLIYGKTPYSRQMFVEDFIEGVPDYSRYILEKDRAIYTPVVISPQEGVSDKIYGGNGLYHRSGMVSANDSAQNIQVMNNGHGYLLTDYRFHQKLTPELDMWFPRMTSSHVSDRLAYADWAGMTEENMSRVPVSETIDSNGNFQPRINGEGERAPVYSYRPTYTEQLKYFIAYQSYYMYFRYLFWNFIGRQNDYHSTGEIEHGNFITGIDPIDSRWFGVTDRMPPEIGSENAGRNLYFGIPFALGIIGIVALACRGRAARRVLTVIALIFVMTGPAIVMYLNQSPGEPRERDYTFLVSYMAFAMWIAAGIAALCFAWLKGENKWRLKISLTICVILSLGIPGLMAAENFDDHNRSGRYQPAYYASSILDFELPSLVFSHGDNSTFPQWYSMEVLGKWPDHVPVDVTYLTLPSYIMNLKRSGTQGVPTYISPQALAYNTFILTRIPADTLSSPVPLSLLLEELYATPAGKDIPKLASSLVKIPSSQTDSVVINLHDFSGGSSYLSFRHLMLLDFMASQSGSPAPKALYFPYAIDHSFYKALGNTLQPVLFGKIYAPWLSEEETSRLMARSVRRELQKSSELPQSTPYVDPVIADRSSRYRGEMTLAALQLLETGDTALAKDVAEMLIDKYPYSTLLPGTFTLADSTFYEGREFLRLLRKLEDSDKTGEFARQANALDSLIVSRKKQWLLYYQSLSPEQRATLSPRSKRIMRYL